VFFAHPVETDRDGVQAGFESLAELDPVTLVFGPQGGYHIVGAARVCNMPVPAYVTFRIVHEETGALISNVLYGVNLENEPPCCASRANLYGYLDTREMPGGGQVEDTVDLLADEVVVMTMEVEDASYACIDSRRTTVVWP